MSRRPDALYDALTCLFVAATVLFLSLGLIVAWLAGIVYLLSLGHWWSILVGLFMVCLMISALVMWCALSDESE